MCSCKWVFVDSWIYSVSPRIHLHNMLDWYSSFCLKYWCRGLYTCISHFNYVQVVLVMMELAYLILNTLPKKCFSTPFHLQISKRPEGVEGRLISHFCTYHCPKKVTPKFLKFANKKARRNIFWGVYNKDTSIVWSNKFEKLADVISDERKSCRSTNYVNWRLTSIQKAVIWTNNLSIIHTIT